MRFPVKINRSRLPDWCHHCVPSMDDPRKLISSDADVRDYERSVSAIKTGKVWRSTRKQRHPLTDALIVERTSRLPRCSVLDVGASSGVTSLDLLKRLGARCEHYYVTDVSFDLAYVVQGKTTYLYEPAVERCILGATDWFIVYSDTDGAISPLGSIATRMLSRAPRVAAECQATVSLLHPELRVFAERDSRVRIVRHDVLTPWTRGPVDVVKAANILNRTYFSDREISQALAHLTAALESKGTLVITENRDVEKVSIFAKGAAGGLELKDTVNGGSDITELACRPESAP